MTVRMPALALAAALSGAAANAQNAGPAPGSAAPPPPGVIGPHPATSNSFLATVLHPNFYPSPAPAAPQAPALDRSDDIDKSTSGWGWCSYIDATDKKAFYSDVFFADPSTGQLPIGVNYKDYVKPLYAAYIKATYNVAGGDPKCQWWPYATNYLQLDAEKSDEFAWQAMNFQVIESPWKP